MSGNSKKVALVTGAGRGIGKAAACVLAKAGMHVFLLSRTVAEIENTQKQIEESGGSAEAVVCDVSDAAAVSKVFGKIEAEKARLDVLINNAAVLLEAPFVSQKLEDWDRVMAVNVRGAFICAQHAFRLMAERKAGVIVNVASLGGIQGSEKFPGFSAYTVSKYAVVGLTEAMAAEAGPLGVRVVCVAPGAVDTAMLKKAAPSLRTQTTPDHIADIIRYLVLAEPGVPLNGTVLEIHSNA
ncbi:MAG: SDR family oxidoreductase [Bdellovibrionaceae bacterium]|nr:SDR family oxidoreductase [Pseudobdellovibrionaceae bacterium]